MILEYQIGGGDSRFTGIRHNSSLSSLVVKMVVATA